MKRFILCFAALAALLSCTKESTETPGIIYEYYLDSEDASNLDMFKELLRANCSAITDSTFIYEGDLHKLLMSEAVAAGWDSDFLVQVDTLVADRRKEDAGNTFMWPIVNSSSKSVTFNLFFHDYQTDEDGKVTPTYRNADIKFKVESNCKDGTHAETLVKKGMSFEPLKSVKVSNQWWSYKDDKKINSYKGKGYTWTCDLNDGCGVKSDYTRLYFGGTTNGNSDKQSDFANDPTITGLRLVTIPSGLKDDKKTIVDSDGITWHAAESSGDNLDLNSKGGGDNIYLYYTTDYTGRKICLVSPVLFDGTGYTKTEKWNSMAALVLGGICSWNTSTGGSDGCFVSDLKCEIGIQVWEDWYNNGFEDVMTSDQYHHYDDADNNIDFVRLFDENMEPIGDHSDEGHPANFNRNARGNNEIFISYPYIDKKSKYWDQM